MRRLALRSLLLLLSLLVLLGAAGATRAASPPAPVLLVVGDSISAGYGLSSGQVWVDLLAARLKSAGYPQRVVNASISGDTTAGGRARLPALLKQHEPALVIIELGGNDALRGGRLSVSRENLDAMVAAAQAAGAKVLVVGMQLPPNYGPAYVREFGAMFPAVAKARKAALVPYFFEGFGDDLAYFQADRIHPTAAAQERLLDNVWPTLKPMLGAPDDRIRPSGTARRSPGQILRQPQGRHRGVTRASDAHRRAQPFGICTRPHPRCSELARARRRRARGGRHAARAGVGLRGQAARCGDRRPQHRAHRRRHTALAGRTTGRR